MKNKSDSVGKEKKQPLKTKKEAVLGTDGKKRTQVKPKTKSLKNGSENEEPKAEKKLFDRTVLNFQEDRYRVIKKFFQDRGDEFEVICSGTSEKFRINGLTYVPLGSKDMIGKGFHLSRLVKKDVDKWLDKNIDTLQKRNRDYKEQCFNVAAIENNLNKFLVSIDINDCYWQTIYNLGYITKNTYEMGLKKKEWKLGRNAAIGSLNKVEIITRYKNGQVMLDESGRPIRIINRKDMTYQHVRHNIIGYVWDMFAALAEMLGDDFYMFLTDCVFTTYERKKEVEDFFAKYGYSCKSKSFEFTNIDKESRTVEWIELKNSDTLKYYRYAKNQLI
jgi:hypothetical protein